MSDKQKRPEKISIYREVTELLKGKSFAFLVNFGGLTVVQISDLRKELGAKKLSFAVIKNSLIAKVAADVGWDDLSSLLAGPTGVVTGEGDVASVAKLIVDFIKKNEKASVKGGQIANKLLTADEVIKLSELISLAAQQARLLGTLQAPASKMARVLQAKVDADSAPAEAAEVTEAAVVADVAEVAEAAVVAEVPVAAE